LAAGFTISFLGTGAGGCILRNHTAIVVECPDGTRVLLDAASGNTVLRHADLLGMSPVDFDHCLLSHSHPDHCEGLPHIEMQRSRRNPAEQPMNLYGSPEALADIGTLLSYPRRGLSVDGDGAQRRDGRRVFAFRPTDPGQWVQLSPTIRARCAPVDHIGGAIAWRVEADGHAVVFSGDTRWCPSLAELAEGATLLIHEAICTEADRRRADNAAHSTAAEAARIAQLAGVQQLTLTHIDNAFHYDPEPLAVEARSVYDGPVSVASDCWQQQV
jgi:ribonuclease BN (tRNA processing enzyme)